MNVYVNIDIPREYIDKIKEKIVRGKGRYKVVKDICGDNIEGIKDGNIHSIIKMEDKYDKGYNLVGYWEYEDLKYIANKYKLNGKIVLEKEGDIRKKIKIEDGNVKYKD